MEDTYELLFHGTAKRGGDTMAVGAVLVRGGEVVEKKGGVVSYPGNFEKAHWEAMIQGMILAREKDVRRLIIKGDSRSVINHMNGEPPGKEFTAMDYLKIARDHQKDFDQCFFQYIPASQNGLAIDLARSALEMG